MQVSVPAETPATFIFFTVTKETIHAKSPHPIQVNCSSVTHTGPGPGNHGGSLHSCGKHSLNLPKIYTHSQINHPMTKPSWRDLVPPVRVRRGSRVISVSASIGDLGILKNCRHSEISLNNIVKSLSRKKRSSAFAGLGVYKSRFLREFYRKIGLKDAGLFLQIYVTNAASLFVIEKDTSVEAPEHTRNAGLILIPITYVR